TGVKYLEQILPGYTAVVCYNDEIASRLVAQLVKRGISIPEDMAVVSFDNSQYSEMTTPRITSLSHGTHNVGRMAAELLMHLFEGVPCQSQVAPWTLVQKESS
ncbi:MAG: substrate-binding domain-containing protein, partial [Oscillospiraceae bacterium]|nr:substrate-binding domain-containing protein [Oscillospiraceae bacterium]